MGCPWTTTSPLCTRRPERNEHVESRPPPWSIVTNNRPPTLPANVTTPAAGARTTLPTGAAMSMPRWPDPYGEPGGSNARTTGPLTGHVHVPLANAGLAGAADRTVMTSESTRNVRFTR